MNYKILFALSAIASVSVFGCGGPAVDRPANAAPIPKSDGERKIPRTKAEKIEAINKAPISAEEKKRAIATVEAGPD